MAQKADPHMFSPEDLANESLFEDEEPLTRPGVTASQVPPPRSAKTQNVPRIRVAKDPDAEAIEIVTKVAEKIAVARSLARIASSVVRSFADQKMTEIVETDGVGPTPKDGVSHHAVAHVGRARRVAIAAKEAAVHAASLAVARAAARTQEFVAEASSLVDSLDHEQAHDDAR